MEEIAAYLGVGVRTAQMWERERGLPVNRLPGGRGRVYIDVSALEAWKVSRPGPLVEESPGPDVPASPPPTVGSRKWWRHAMLAAAILSGVTAAAMLWPRHGPPAQLSVDRNTLIVADDRGREVFRKTFASLTPAVAMDPRYSWFGDLDGDGHTEVLVAPVGTSPEPGIPLVCYSEDGRERWRFTPGRTVRSPTETFAPPFSVSRFTVARLGKQHRLRALVISHHILYYPTLVALLAPDGTLLREYWHSGGFSHFVLADLDRDGSDEILLAGPANSTKGATLVVLNPDEFAGASVEDNPAYQLQGFPPGREKARLLFPRSCINIHLEPFVLPDMLLAEPGEVILEMAHRLPDGAGLIYHLNLDLSLRSLGVSSSFEREHKALEANRVLDHPFGEAEDAALRHIVYRKSMPAAVAAEPSRHP